MDYGERAPGLGWRMPDAWLSMAGASSKGLPNGRPIDEFFGRPVLVTEARMPLAATGTEGRFDVSAILQGGGISGQAGALRHGIARALTVADEALRSELKKGGFLTRDARIKERKKSP